MNEQSVSKQDRLRKRAMIIFQILMYGYLATMFAIQLYMYSTRDW